MNEGLNTPDLVTDRMRHAKGAGDLGLHTVVTGVGLAALLTARERRRPHWGGLLVL
jgi:hypothetical protein